MCRVSEKLPGPPQVFPKVARLLGRQAKQATMNEQNFWMLTNPSVSTPVPALLVAPLRSLSRLTAPPSKSPKNSNFFKFNKISMRCKSALILYIICLFYMPRTLAAAAAAAHQLPTSVKRQRTWWSGARRKAVQLCLCC